MTHLNRGLAFLFALTLLFGAASKVDAFACFSHNGRCVVWDPPRAHMKFLLGSAGQQLSNGTVTYDQNAVLAAEEWNVLGSPFQFSWQIGTGFIDPCGDRGPGHVCNDTGPEGDNPVFFTNSICGRGFGDVLAQTTTCFETSSSKTLNTPVFFNANENWDAYDGPLRPRYDIRRVIAHQLGHVLGLVHPDDRGQNVRALMNSIVSDVDRPQSDDINGTFDLYGGGSGPIAQTSEQGCAVTNGGSGNVWWLLLPMLIWSLGRARRYALTRRL